MKRIVRPAGRRLIRQTQKKPARAAASDADPRELADLRVDVPRRGRRDLARPHQPNRLDVGEREVCPVGGVDLSPAHRHADPDAAAAHPAARAAEPAEAERHARSRVDHRRIRPDPRAEDRLRICLARCSDGPVVGRRRSERSGRRHRVDRRGARGGEARREPVLADPPDGGVVRIAQDEDQLAAERPPGELRIGPLGVHGASLRSRRRSRRPAPRSATAARRRAAEIADITTIAPSSPTHAASAPRLQRTSG